MFLCKQAGDMLYPELVDSVRYYKETEGGMSQMCRAVEERVQERLEQQMQEKLEQRNVEIALAMIKRKKVKLEDIAIYTGLSLEEVKSLSETAAE